MKGKSQGFKGVAANTRANTHLNAAAPSYEPYTKSPAGSTPEQPDGLENKKQRTRVTPVQTVNVELSISASAMDIESHAAEYAANDKTYSNLPNPIPRAPNRVSSGQTPDPTRARKSGR